MQTLGGIRRYLADYLESRDRRAAAKAGDAARLVSVAKCVDSGKDGAVKPMNWA